MARTTSEAVLKILLKDYDDTNIPDLSPFIETASAVTDRVEECATERETPLTSSELELVERWLSAHFYGQTDQPYSSKSTADSSGSFQGQTGKYYENTKYGQSAVSIDPSDCLAEMLAEAVTAADVIPRSGSVHWVGKPPSAQVDYEDRD